MGLILLQGGQLQLVRLSLNVNETSTLRQASSLHLWKAH